MKSAKAVCSKDVKKSDQIIKANYLKSLSDDRKRQLNGKDRARKATYRQLLSAEKKKQMQDSDKNRKTEFRSIVNSSKRQFSKEKDRVRKQYQRKKKVSSMSVEQLQCNKRVYAETRRQQRNSNNIHCAIQKFKKNIKDFAKYVCTSCNKLLYRRSVVRVTQKVKDMIVKKLCKLCISGKSSAAGFEWLCMTCRSYLNRHKMPPQADANKLKVPNPPPELEDLTSLEVRLLCKRYPFMKLLALPKGRQSAIRGSVVNVPVDCDAVCSSLPRTPGAAGIIPLRQTKVTV